MSILGNRVLRTEDPKFLTVGGSFVADLRDPLLDGALHVAYVRSMVAHGTIAGIEVDDAKQPSGVVAVTPWTTSSTDPRSLSRCRC